MSARVARIGVTLLLVIASACTGDYELERRGGPFPTSPVVDPLGGAAAVGGADGNEGGMAGAGAGLIAFCDALSVIRAKCQRCHSDPPENGAPVPFVTFEDLHATYAGDTQWWMRAQMMVEIDYMPYVTANDPPISLMPPVEPLSADEKTTLMTWFMQGALPDGGTDCP